MILKTTHNLLNATIEFINNVDRLSLFSAYIKLDQLKVLNESKNIKQIIVRWEIEDLIKKVSDIELYDYCRDNNIILYRNDRLHMKAIWDNSTNILLGSANVTGRGIGERGRYNYELNSIVENISADDVTYLQYVINKSQLVDDELYKEIKHIVDTFEDQTIEFPILETRKSSIDFLLISQLPLSYNPDELYQCYNAKVYTSEEQMLAVTHDIALYDIPSGLNEPDFFETLKNSFNNHPFVLRFKEAIKNEPDRTMRFGSVRIWFKENTTTVPIPTAWELSENVRILYDWIEYFDSEFEWNRPGGHSQVIAFVG